MKPLSYKLQNQWDSLLLGLFLQATSTQKRGPFDVLRHPSFPGAMESSLIRQTSDCFPALEMSGKKPAGWGCGERKRMTWSQKVSHPCQNERGERLSLATAPHLWGAAMPVGNDTQGCSGEGGSLVDSPTLG